MNISKLTITGNELVKILTKRDFLARLSEAARITQQSGLETNFNMLMNKKKMVFLTDILVGSHYSTEPESDEFLAGWVSKTVYLIDKYEAFTFLDLHFHPDELLILPSETDLKRFQGDESSPSIVAIAIAARSLSHIDLLLISRKRKLLPSDIDYFEYYSRDLKSQSDIGKLLSENGFYNILVTYRFSRSKTKLNLPNNFRRQIIEGIPEIIID